MRRVLFTGALVFAFRAAAQDLGRDAYNPGQLGPNALPPPANEPAWVAPSPQIEWGVAVQRTQSVFGADDASLTMPFRVEVPFLGRASVLVEGQPFEWWLASVETRAAWQPSTWNGFSKADIRIGGKFLIFNGGLQWPSVSLRALVKTTTGKDFFDHRFINAPGYLFDLLFSHRFVLPRGWSIDAVFNGGFLAWQQGAFGQNDAPSFSLGVRAGRPEFHLIVEARTYWGYQHFDKPWLLSIRIELPLSRWLTVYVGANLGLRDPAYFDARTGLRFGLPVEPRRKSDLHEGQMNPFIAPLES
ncbi:MAG: hypothetical protein K1X64_02915 [Myxococcaceae bacterium]|nr:hypothetical protein [Myxococcaceae bacterium]